MDDALGWEAAEASVGAGAQGEDAGGPAEVRAVEAGAGVAILGHACRLPGAPDPQAYWRLLVEGESAIVPLSGRWDRARYWHPDPRHPGRSHAEVAGLVDGIWDFDAGFFGFSAREAEQTDPQQRLLLMTVWEAIEDAGLTSRRLGGGRTGVYVGCSASDHAHLFLENPRLIDPSFMTGNTLSLVANRISHCLDLGGPSQTVDTACSSSLVALDQAVRALTASEIDIAVVGGVHALLSPLPFVGFAQAGMLSATGRLRAFDAEADGYVRGEGAVALVLGRSTEACTAGDRPRAVIRATATNTEGRTGGLTRPSSARQQALIETALAASGLDRERIAFVEAHGTGTPVGDPVEAEAIGRALGRRSGPPLPIGSVKPQIGHLEPASGLAGLLKAALALEHRELPASRGCETPSPAIDWKGLGIAPARTQRPLEGARPAAIVNSFGFGGANASVVMEVTEARATPVTSEPPLLVISAASKAALAGQLLRWRAHLGEASAPEAAALVSAAAHRREHLRHRAVVAATGELSASARLADDTAIVQGQRPEGPARLVFVFSGNGSQVAGMGAGLREADPAFRAAHDHVSRLFRAIDPAQDPREPGDLADPCHAQPALFALQVALVEALAARGLRAEAVLGHSVGEVAAAWCAGGLGLEEAVRLIATRAPLVVPLAGTGGMAAVLASAEETEAAIAASEIPDLVLSGDNSPRSSTVTGSPDGLEAFAAHARATRLALRRLAIQQPYHSPALEPLREPFRAALGGLAARAPVLPFASATDGQLRTEAPDLDYWWRNLREPVRFREATAAMAEAGGGIFLEIGPRPVLARYLTDTLAAIARPGVALASLDGRTEDDATLPAILSNAVAHGAPVDARRVYGPTERAWARPPHYGWQLERHCLADQAAPAQAHHPLLGPAQATGLWEQSLDPQLFPWLADHRVEGAIVVPAAALAAIALAAGMDAMPRPELIDLTLIAPLPLTPDRPRRLRTRLEAESGLLTIESAPDRPGENLGWQLHARATLREDAGHPIVAPSEAADGGGALPAHRLYQALSGDGLDYGPAFRRAGTLDLGPDVVELPIEGSAIFDTGLDIAALDTAFQALQPVVRAALPDVALEGDLLLPSRIGRLRVAEGGPARRARVLLRRASPRSVTADLVLLDSRGTAVVGLTGLRLARAARRPALTQQAWTERLVPISPGRPPAPCLPVGEPDAADETNLLFDGLARRLAWDATTKVTEGGPGSARLATAAREALGEEAPPAPCPTPPLPALIRAIVARAPDEAARLGETVRQGDALSAWHATAPPPPMRQDGTALGCPRRSKRAAALMTAARDLLGRWPVGSRRDVLLVAEGAVGEAIESALLEAGAGRVVICEPWTLAGGQFDAALLLDPPAGWDRSGLVTRLSPGAAVLSAERWESPLDILEGAARKIPGSSHAGRFAAVGLAAEETALPGGDALVAARLPQCASPKEEPTAPPYGARIESAQVDPALAAALAARLGPARGEAAPLLLLVDPDGEPAGRLATAVADIAQQHARGPHALWVVLRSSEPAGACPLAQGIVGFLRCLANEAPERPARLAILATSLRPETAAAALASHIGSPPEDRAIWIDGCGTRAMRVHIHKPSAEDAAVSGADGALRLEARPGRPFGWRSCRRRSPGRGEIEISVTATGLNFRDVLLAQGALPEEAVEDGLAGAGLGMELAGHVIRAGPDTALKEGTPVMALAANAFASHATVPEAAAVTLPPGLAPEEAAGLPVAFLTAIHALVDLAHVSSGESVLVHGAAGGVGLAAMQVARAAGARVFATAGSPAKRALVSALGAEHVFDSRGLGFADAVLEATGGSGVDVVLNSLAGEPMRRSLDCLAPFGRFLELGKRDFLSDTRIGLRRFRTSISYHSVDIDRLASQRPDATTALLHRLADGISSGTYRPLPFRQYDAGDAEAAMRLMRGSGHFGKIVVKPPTPDARKVARPMGHGAWLITGGLGGFGLAAARCLAESGVREFWLVGRSGRPRPEDEHALEDLKRRGTTIRCVAADMSDPNGVAKLLSQLRAETRLEGILHAAAVIEDGAAHALDRSTAERVIQPKLAGATLLDQMTREDGLTHFVLFGSLAAALGNPGQGAYAAANAALDGLAARRRAEGRPAMSIAWGPIADAGALARDPLHRERMEAAGLRALSADAALKALPGLLALKDPPAAIRLAAANWSRLGAMLSLVRTELFGDLRVATETPAREQRLVDRLTDLAPAAALRELTDALRATLSRLLQLPKEEIEIHRPVGDLGLDSLMAMDLRLMAEDQLGLALPPAVLSGQASLAEIARRTLAERGSSSKAEADGLMDRHLAEGNDRAVVAQAIQQADA